MLDDLVSRGAYVSGTVPKSRRTNSPPFATFANRAAMTNSTTLKGAHNFIENATKSAYWVTREIPNNKLLYLLALRHGHGNRIAFLATSDPKLGPNTYCLERAGAHHQHFGLLYDEDRKILSSKQETLFAASNYGCISFFRERKVRFVTERQADAVWFLFRQFRFTSTTARKVFMAIKKDETVLSDDSNPILLKLCSLKHLLGINEPSTSTDPPAVDLDLANYSIFNVAELKIK